MIVDQDSTTDYEGY